MKVLVAVVALLVVLGLLLIPEGRPPLPRGAGRKPFLWDQAEMWKRLETRFKAARRMGCEAVQAEIDASFDRMDELLAALADSSPEPGDETLLELETRLFEASPLVAVCTDRVSELMDLAARLRAGVKGASRGWDIDSKAARDQVYRLLYGSRAALEEVLLQASAGRFSALVRGADEPSATPSVEVHGVRLHSGDVLVSRGGASTSALIARGNDYPGNFSHIALLHVDEATGEATIVEAHIERGAATATVGDYLRATKLRIMVLRLRRDLPQLVADPLLPHRAATRALEEVRRRHIPYDFEMDYQDPEKQFCSEVASAFYGAFGVELWQGLTSISLEGVAGWLATLGVRHFEGHGPSDLEYDSQLRVVAEWRDPETLYQDHVDNAVVDALLEGAERGDEIGYAWHLLGAVRLAKAYSWVLNRTGRTGPIPEGMSATAALRVRWLQQRHAALKARVLELADEFAGQQGYTAPYWELVRLARQAKSEADGGS